MANDEYNVKRFTNNKWETLHPLSKIKNNPELFTEDLAKTLVALDEAQTKLKDLETKLAKLFGELNSDNYNEEELKYVFDELNSVYGKFKENKTSN